MDQKEFKFPDEELGGTPKEEELQVVIEGDEVAEIEIVDDTPEQDRGRKPSPPPAPVSEEELSQYSEKVQERIRKFTKGYHDERRAKEAALREKEQLEQFAKSLLEENNALKGTQSQSQKLILEQAKKSAEQEVDAAKKLYKDAFESGNADAITEAQDKLTEARVKLDRIKNIRLPSVQEEKVDVKQDKPKPELPKDSAPKVPKRVLDWAEANSDWFNVDDEMTAFAFGVDASLKANGVVPGSDEYYEKLDSRMRQVFPDRFDKPKKESIQEKRPSSPVAPATRSTATKKVVITKTAAALAKRMGIPLEEYAKHQAALMRKEQNG